MPLEGNELARFQMLQGQWVDLGYLHDFYDLDCLPDNQSLRDALTQFANGKSIEENGAFNRYLIELYFGKSNLLPKRWMAARMGMKTEFLDILLAGIAALPLPRRNYVLFDALVDERLSEDLVNHLPGLRFRSFSDHESFCQRLHNALIEPMELSEQRIHEMSLWCATDQALARIGDGDYPRRYAMHFDCITCEPLSVAHAVWLDFRKPLSLGPDRCSKLTYVRHLDELQDYLAGTRGPDNLERYQHVLEGAQA